MKKILTLSLMLILCAGLLFATQATYRRDSDEVRDYYTLCTLCGQTSPDPAFPITGSQLLKLVKNLDGSKLDGAAAELLSNLISKLESPEVTATYGDCWADIELPYSVWLRGRTSDETLGEKDADYVIFDRGSHETGHGFDFMIGIGDNFTGRIDYTTASRDDASFRNDNILLIDPLLLLGSSGEERKPYYAYASVGNDTLNFVMGRDRTSAGNGVTGNIGFGDQMIYQEFAKFSAVGKAFSYDLTVYAFDNQVRSNFNIESFCHNKPFQTVVSHRFSFNVTKYFTFSAYESVLTYGDTYSMIKLLDPFMVLHNTYAFSDSNNNNFVGIELDLALDNIRFFAAFMLDQWQYDFEIRKKGVTNIAPNAWAAQLNAVGTWVVEDGILEGYAEAVYTSPVCYLKEIHGKNGDGPEWYHQDMLVSERFSEYGNIEFLGYEYGPDTVAFGTGASYRKSSFEFGLDGLFLASGSYGRIHDRILFGSELGMTDEESQAYMNALSPFVFDGEAVEFTVQLTAWGSWDIIDGIELDAGLGFIHVSNWRNAPGAAYNDLQFSLATTIDIMPYTYKLLSKLF